MATRQKSEIVVADSTSVEPQSKSIVRRKRGEIAASQNASNGDAILAEELTLAFDPEMCAAIVMRLVQEKDTIRLLSTQEEQLSRALEVSRLGAIEAARQRGIATARAENAQSVRQLKERQQKEFIENDLPQLIDSCDYLPYQTMKNTVESFAAIVKVKLYWEEDSEGGYTCTAKPI